MPDEFDVYASKYAETVAESVGAVGGSVEHFAQRKVHVLQDVLTCNPERILDFGCGIGILSNALADGYASASVVGIDTSVESINHARTRHSQGSHHRLEFLANSGAKLPLPDHSVELAVAACVFHHIGPPERNAWFAELHRVVAPGGYCVIFEHNPRNPLTRRAVWRCPFDADAVLLPAKESRDRLRVAGFVDTGIVNYLFLPPALYRFRALERWLHWLSIGGQYMVFGRAAR